MSLSDRFYSIKAVNGEFLVDRVSSEDGSTLKSGLFSGDRSSAIQYVKDRGRFYTEQEKKEHEDFMDKQKLVESVLAGMTSPMEMVSEADINRPNLFEYLKSWCRTFPQNVPYMERSLREMTKERESLLKLLNPLKGEIKMKLVLDSFNHIHAHSGLLEQLARQNDRYLIDIYKRYIDATRS